MTRFWIGLSCLIVLGSQMLLLSQVPARPAPVVKQIIIRGQIAPKAAAAPTTIEVVSDEKILEGLQLKANNVESLHSYLRQRTLSDVDQGRILDVIQRLGSADFEERLKATKEVELFGPAAVGPLRKAATIDQSNINGTNFEIAYRASDVLKRLEKVPHTAVARAVIRALAKNSTAETTKILLAFLPAADDYTVVDEIRKTLTILAVRNGKADPALVSTLKDASALKRSMAALALIEGGPTTQPIHIPDAYPQVREAAKVETDVDTRFKMLFALVTVAKAKDCIPDLISQLTLVPRGQLWQAEDFLLQAAGSNAPKATFGKSKESLAKAQAAWSDWWTKSGPSFNADQFTYKPRIHGRMLLAFTDNSGVAGGSVVEMGPDMKERWRIDHLLNPMDMKVMPDGNIAIAEYQSTSVNIYDINGRKLATKNITGNGNNRIYGNPHQIQLLDNGGMLIVCRNVVIEVKATNGKEEQTIVYNRMNNYDISSALRLPNGETVVMLQSGPNHCVFVDSKGAEIPDRKLKVGQPYYQGHMELVGKDNLLVTEMQQVAEYNMKDNKLVWKKAAPMVKSVQRLPNGNTLMIESNTSPSRLVEVAPDGEEVWSYQASSTRITISRAYRQ